MVQLKNMYLVFLMGIILMVLMGCQESNRDMIEYNISYEAEMENAKHISIEENQVTYSDENLEFCWENCGYYHRLGYGEIINLDKVPTEEDDTTQGVEINIFRVDDYTNSTDLEFLAKQAAGVPMDSENIFGSCHAEDKNRWNYVVHEEYTKEIILDSVFNRYEGKSVQCVKSRNEYGDYIIYQGYALTDGKKVVTCALSKHLNFSEDLNDFIDPTCEEDNLLFQMCRDVVSTIEMH